MTEQPDGNQSDSPDSGVEVDADSSTPESIDTRPSGRPYLPPADLSRAVSTVFRQMVGAVYCALSPLVVLVAGAALLAQGLWWRLCSLLFWQALPTSAGGLDQWLYAPTANPPIGLRYFSESLVVHVYGEFLSPWGQLAAARDLPFLFYLAGALGSLAIWSLAGTLICRLVGLRLVRGTGKWKDAWHFARQSFVDSLGSIAIPLIAVVVLSLPLALVGLLLMGNVSSTIGSVLIVLLGALSIPMAIVLVGLALSWPLMFPAIAMEGRDCFESISRGYAYVLQRPFHYLFLVVVSLIMGTALSWLFQFLGESAIGLLYWATSWGANAYDPGRMNELLFPVVDSEPTTGTLVTHFSSPLLHFWGGVIRWMVRATTYSVFWGLATGVYVLLRHYLDQAPLDAIYVEGKNKLEDLESDQPDSTTTTD